MKKEVILIFERQSEREFACLAEGAFEGFGLRGFGADARAAERDMLCALEEMCGERGEDVPALMVKQRHFDVGSFFSYYPFLNISQVAAFAGVNASQLRQYAAGVRVPGERKRAMLTDAFRRLAGEFYAESLCFRID